MATWTCYHVIGDTLRGTHGAVAARRVRAFRSALAAEPTVLAPQRAQRARRPATWAWAAAATLAAVTVVGWTAFSLIERPPTAVAKAREAAAVRAAQAAAAAVAAGLSARAPGILAGDGDPGRAVRICARSRTATATEPRAERP